MKVEVKKIDPIKRELSFEVSKERVTEKTEQVYKEMGKVAKVKGFRPGKVPRNILEKHYGREAREEVLQKVIPDVYQEALTQENIFPIDMPDIKDVSFNDGVIKFKAVLEIKPEVKVKDYKGIKVKRKSSKVTDEELNKTLDYFKAASGKDKDVKIDDDFAKGLGYPSLDDFKQVISRQMEMDKDRANRYDVENQIIEALLKKSKVVAPESLVNRQMQKRVEETKARMKQQGMKDEDISKKEKDMPKELKPLVEKDIKSYLILDKIAELEEIKVEEGGNLPAKVMEFLFKEASWEGESKKVKSKDEAKKKDEPKADAKEGE